MPKVSVIIPVYNGSQFVGEAISSVLSQTFADFEIIVVNDASTDATDEVIGTFVDPRLKYLVHQKNRGLPATRNTGVRAATGEYIALLDHDDLFHREKLAAHVKLLDERASIGVSYNSRFELGDSADSIREIWRAPGTVTLADLVLGYPFSPSDIVFRREWIDRIGLFDEENRFHGEDLNTNTRLALEGCQFGAIDRALNYRRNHPARVRKNLDDSLMVVLRNLDCVFENPKCPGQVSALRDLAFATNYLVWTYMALAQQETDLGQRYLGKAIQLNPALLEGEPCELLNFLVMYCVNDERGELGAHTKSIFSQLPTELSGVSERMNWAMARGYLVRGTRDVMWKRPESARENLARAAELNVEIDESFVQFLTWQLLNYENEFGEQATLDVLGKLAASLTQAGDRRSGRRLEGAFLVNHAFRDYHHKRYSRVPKKVVKAMLNDPSYIANRGVASIFIRSLVHPMTASRQYAAESPR